MSDQRRQAANEEVWEAARLLTAAARRRDAAAGQLAIPDALRLSDWHLATVRGLLAGMARAVEDQLRSGLAPRFVKAPALHASLASADLPIALPVIERSGLSREPDLLAHLLRRAEEIRVHRAGRTARAGDPIIALVRDSDAAVAADAMSLLVASSRRLDGEPMQAPVRTELPAELQHRLVWIVAAALRLYMIEQHQVAEADADSAIGTEAEALIAAYDESDTLESHCLRLACRLKSEGRLDDALLEQALAAGALPFFLAGIAARAGLTLAAAWEVLHDPNARGPAILLRAAGVAAPAAAAILLALDVGDEVALGRQRDLFDTLEAGDADDKLLLWRIDPAYRTALAGMLRRQAA